MGMNSVRICKITKFSENYEYSFARSFSRKVRSIHRKSLSIWGCIAMDESGASNDSGSPPQPCPGGGVDLISALPDDLLLQVLERLGSVAAAVRSGLVSRRWRDLWTSLPKVTVALHDIPFGSLLAALRRATRPGVCHYYLDIRVPRQDDRIAPSSVSTPPRCSRRWSYSSLYGRICKSPDLARNCTTPLGMGSITICSASLQELVVDA
jgi:hypothetical protein